MARPTYQALTENIERINNKEEVKGIEAWLEFGDKFENPGIPTIRVIGIDGKWHEAEGHKDTCLCGMKIYSKNENLPSDSTRFSCYECTY